MHEFPLKIVGEMSCSFSAINPTPKGIATEGLNSSFL